MHDFSVFRTVHGPYDVPLDDPKPRFGQRRRKKIGRVFWLNKVRACSTLFFSLQRRLSGRHGSPSPLRERAVKGDPCHRTRRIAPDAYRPLVFSFTFLTRSAWHSLGPPHCTGAQTRWANSCSRLRLASGP